MAAPEQPPNQLAQLALHPTRHAHLMRHDRDVHVRGSALTRVRFLSKFQVVIALVIFALGAAVVGVALLPGEMSGGGTLRKPIDRRQQTALEFGERSHWLQPWRAYLDTPPATRLRDAIGINFNVEPAEADATARLLRESGFRRARLEIGWDRIEYDNPSRLADRRRFEELVGALVRHGIRPLILLNAHHGAPGPTRFFAARLARPAAAGARRVQLARATARRAVPGRTGLNDPNGKAADVLFTQVARDGTATLSKPLPRRLAAGVHPAATLRYEPFGPPLLENGRPNPTFEATMDGWLAYARTVAGATRAIVGSDEFDVEIWNELSFGSDFLDQARYYDPPRERGRGDVKEEILQRTVRALRARGAPARGIGIANGFASQTPFPAGSTSPPGLTALSKHPYYGVRRFPQEAVRDAIAPLDALGRRAASRKRLPGGETVFRDAFIPRYNAFFPEYILTAIQTETLIRDLSPITTLVNGTPHGRRTHPPGARAPGVWVTEANLDPTGADPTDPSSPGSGPIDRLTPADTRRLHAKAALRYYTAFVNKGVSAVFLFGVKGGPLALVDPRFFKRLRTGGGAYPGASAGGETPRAVARLARALKGAEPANGTQPLSLLSVSDAHDNVQFEGDGTRAHPPLYDRDVTAFLPFQVRPGRWMAAVYVMTRDMAELQDEGAPSSDPRRYDLPAAPFTLAIGGLDASRVKARATDPLTGSSVPVRIVARTRRALRVEMPLTDSPRLLSLTNN